MATDCGTSQVVIKNTFIQHVFPTPVQPRRKSVPSSARLNTGIANLNTIKDLSKGLVTDSFSSPISEASTDSGAASEDESVDSSPAHASLWQSAGIPEAIAVPQVQHVMLFAVPLSSFATPLVPSAPEPVKQATKLCTQAKTFTPGCCLQQKPPGTKLNANARKRCARFRWQCQQVARSAMEAIAACTFVQSVEVVEEKSNLSIDAYILPEHFHGKEHALSKAKDAFLQSAEESDGVYVLGYRSKPFLTTSEGFFVILGVMTCMKEACWDTFCYGCCKNKGACNLTHPVYQAPVYVNVKVAT